MRKAAERAALIGVMVAGGLLYAGLSQAQDAGVQGERAAELAAAAGGPASSDHLIPFEADKAAVEVRDDDVAAAQQSGDKASTIPAVMVDTAREPEALATAQAGPTHPSR